MAPPKAVRSTWVDAERGTRLLAAIIDSACSIGVYILAILTGEPMLLFMGLTGLAAYQVYLLSTFGQTIGKKVMNIKIVKIDTDENGGLVTNVLIRGVLNGIIGLTLIYVIVDILFIFRDDRRCIHDLIAGTRVVSEEL